MSDQGEKICPLCAEQMDLTDQQLKPCNCGYDICVWCWHHIMDMAEKDGTEGRCPACRAPYNKEKIVGPSSNCERLVAEMSMDKKTKAKSKSKMSDGRKQLTNVRVVQHDLVYVMGLPLHLADENLLQGKQYFAQYGKVLKVSLSRTAAGTIQQFANNTCSVYITYSKEEEAVRCIQAVHGFLLEDRPLRACFGTTKYCNAWLRNAACSNPDCVYLHEFGSEEVSFTKDETVSGYTRSKVHPTAGVTYDTQRRSGNVLPPPTDEFCNNSYTSSGKPINKIATANTDIQSDNILGASAWQTPASSIRSPPNSSSRRSVGLPAAASWGVCTSNSQSALVNVASLNGPPKQKADTCSGSLAFSTAVANPLQASTIHNDAPKKPNEAGLVARQKGKVDLVEKIDRRTASDISATHGHHNILVPTTECTKSVEDIDESCNMSHNPVSYDNHNHSLNGSLKREPDYAVECEIQNVCSDMPSLCIDGSPIQQCNDDRKPLLLNGVTSRRDTFVSREHPELRAHEQAKVANPEVEDNFLSYNVQNIQDPEVTSHQSYLPSLSQSFSLSDSSRILPAHVSSDSLVVDNKVDKGSIPKVYNVPFDNNKYTENQATGFAKLNNTDNISYMLSNGGKLDDIEESSIISNILSMDFVSWEESVESPQNLAKLLGEADKQVGVCGVSSSCKVQTSNQSRFSFARENDVSNIIPSLSKCDQALENCRPFGNGLVSHGDYYLGQSNGHVSHGDYYLSKSNNSSASSAEDPGYVTNVFSLGSNKSSVSRAPASAPPGFSGPSRAPPPGFVTHEKMIQPTFDIHSGSGYSLEHSSLSRETYLAPSTMNLDNVVDIEFTDPAILAVGKGRSPGGLNSLDMWSGSPQQTYAYDNEAQIESMLQRSLTTHKNQNQRYAEMRGSFSSHPDYYGIPPSRMEQIVAKNVSPFLPSSRVQLRNQQINSYWDDWNEVQVGNELNMAELLNTKRFGISELFNSHEDPKYRMSGSNDMYNHAYGI